MVHPGPCPVQVKRGRRGSPERTGVRRRVELSSLPTQVDFFLGLNLWTPAASASFVQAIPEPTAALCFGAGFGLVAATLRRRARS